MKNNVSGSTNSVDNKTSKKNKKKYSINYKKFSIFLIILLAIIIVIVSIIVNKKVKINENTNISALNSKKNYEEILSKYNEEGMKDRFLADYDAVQTSSGMYMIENMSNEEDSLSKILESIRSDFNSSSDISIFTNLKIDKPTSWNGTWSVTDTGTVKFKFSNKNIEPDWIKNEDVANKVILN
jgi:cytoskeletal protein RodZ